MVGCGLDNNRVRKDRRTRYRPRFRKIQPVYNATWNFYGTDRHLYNAKEHSVQGHYYLLKRVFRHLIHTPFSSDISLSYFWWEQRLHTKVNLIQLLSTKWTVVYRIHIMSLTIWTGHIKSIFLFHHGSIAFLIIAPITSYFHFFTAIFHEHLISKSII